MQPEISIFQSSFGEQHIYNACMFFYVLRIILVHVRHDSMPVYVCAQGTIHTFYLVQYHSAVAEPWRTQRCDNT